MWPVIIELALVPETSYTDGRHNWKNQYDRNVALTSKPNIDRGQLDHCTHSR